MRLKYLSFGAISNDTWCGKVGTRTWGTAYDTTSSVCAEITLIADPDKSFRSDVRITYWAKGWSEEATTTQVRKGEHGVCYTYHFPSHFSHSRPMAVGEKKAGVSEKKGFERLKIRILTYAWLSSAHYEIWMVF